MRSIWFFLIVILVPAILTAQTPRVEISNTVESLRGVSVVSHDVAWASGTHGTYLRTTDAGRTWIAAQVPDAAALDFRAVAAFSADEAFLMSSGTGELSRIYHTADAGKHWQLEFINTNPKGFFDSMVFWDRTHGVALGDPVADESGTLKFEMMVTDDGQTWHPIPPSQLPAAVEGEGAFAASNNCIAILTAAWKSSAAVPSADAQNAAASNTMGADSPDPNIWFATGGKTARVFHSADRGQTWQVFDAPIVHGPDSAGIFSIAFRDAMHGVIAGGDYKRPNADGPNLAFTSDGGKTWTLSTIHPQAFFSSVAYDLHVNDIALHERLTRDGYGKKKTRMRIQPALPQRLFVVGDDFIFDFRPPADPRRVSAKKKLGMKFNAASAFPEGGALVVGPKGSIATVP